MTHYEYELEENLEIKKPKKYNVLLLNDDFSTMDFVIEVLMKIFRKNLSQASQIMLEIHTRGKSVCGTFTKEIASTKVSQVKSKARDAGFPLKAIIEEE